jgi:cellulose synthase (UDP-forming)
VLNGVRLVENFKANWWTRIERGLVTVAIVGICFVFLQKLEIGQTLAELLSFWRWNQFTFGSIAPSTNALILPSLIGVALTFLIVQLYPTSPPKWTRLIVMGILLLLLGRYFMWRLFATLNFNDPFNSTLSVSLLALEILGWISGISSLLLAVFERDRTTEADLMSLNVLQGNYTPWVDVLVPTYNEPVAMLRRTIIGCQGMDYPYKRVYLLDDLRRPEMKQLAEELGCDYFSCPDNHHTKAGNINHALVKIQGELVTVFDCDFIPTRNFLTRTVGFFQQPDIALVQTNRAYYNSDPIRHNLGWQNVITNDEDIGRDTSNSVICGGSSFVVRRQVLDEIGGIPPETLTEDFVTSLKIQALGDRVIYLNESLSAGLAAENIGGYIDQRLRWGQGTIKTLFCNTNPFTLSGLNWIQRFVHGLGVIYWFQSAAYVVFLCLPLADFWWGITPIKASFSELLFFFLPYYFTFAVVFAWLNGSRRSFFWTEVYRVIIAFPVAFMVINTCINPFSKGLKVTPKGISAKRAVLNWQAASPLIILFLLYLVSISTEFLNWQWVQDPDAISIGLYWAIYNTCILFITILIAIDVPQKVFAIRFPYQLNCQLSFEDRVFNGTTNSLSEHSAITSFDLNCLFDSADRIGILNIPGINLFNAPVLIQKVSLDRQSILLAEVEFIELDISKQRKLVGFIFGQPNRWQKQSISEVKSLFSLIGSIFRIYPLTRDFGNK